MSKVSEIRYLGSKRHFRVKLAIKFLTRVYKVPKTPKIFCAGGDGLQIYIIGHVAQVHVRGDRAPEAGRPPAALRRLITAQMTSIRRWMRPGCAGRLAALVYQ